MTIVAYTIGFSTLVFHPSEVVNIIFMFQTMQLSFCGCPVLINADAGSVTPKLQTDKQTDSFPASYTVVEDSFIGVMRQRDKGI